LIYLLILCIGPTVSEGIDDKGVSGHWSGRLYQIWGPTTIATFNYYLDISQTGNEIQGTSRIEKPPHPYSAIMGLEGSIENGILSFSETEVIEQNRQDGSYFILKAANLNYIEGSPQILEGTWMCIDSSTVPCNNAHAGTIFLIKDGSQTYSATTTATSESSSSRTTTTSNTRERKILEGIPSFSQGFTSWCAWVSAQMVLSYYGYNVTPESIADKTFDLADEKWDGRSGLPGYLFSSYSLAITNMSNDNFDVYELTSVSKEDLLSQIIDAIDMGNPIILASNGAWLYDFSGGNDLLQILKWPDGGHASVIVGYSQANEGLVKELPILGVSPPAIRVHDPAMSACGIGVYWLNYDDFFEKVTAEDSFLKLLVIKRSGTTEGRGPFELERVIETFTSKEYLLGRWEGTFNQYSYGIYTSYPMIMNISRIEGNNFYGTLHWPTLRDSITTCEGYIEGDTLQWTEPQLIQGSNIILNGIYKARFVNEDELVGNWYIPEKGIDGGRFNLNHQ
jgi:uncharacterized protein YvpB